MAFNLQLLAWRRHRRLTQRNLAAQTGLTQAFLSRLEKGRGDPTLSSLRRLATALEISVGELVDEAPPRKPLDRQALDELARAALHPGTTAAQRHPEARVLARLIHERRTALGLYIPKGKGTKVSPGPASVHAARWVRASLGEDQWHALLRRIDKLSSAT
jgi:transcriptional regulator with XRE-family HTH domain